jgi:hypothetical protein
MLHCQSREYVIAAQRYALCKLALKGEQRLSSAAGGALEREAASTTKHRCVPLSERGRENHSHTKCVCVSPRKQRTHSLSARRLKSNSRPSATPDQPDSDPHAEPSASSAAINFHPRAPRIYVGAFYNVCTPLDKCSAAKTPNELPKERVA